LTEGVVAVGQRILGVLVFFVFFPLVFFPLYASC
jgi:hypothetical protein